MWLDMISKYIKHFPRTEPHYYKASKKYLQSDLTLPKMYSMFIRETDKGDKPSFSTYSRLFNDMNLEFHRAKKTNVLSAYRF